ncbi:hypothetical protein QBC41DRAFT_320605 [Cercophora samala]|uniref:Uncharacterized protein n=1 Tax=Cercophora samala TaxID=330535 RepID=A0AA39ZER6_9PEZI|nr:hypothetical protein QBC41DRAFT_320605 [Cercophora samala]
MDGLFLSPPAGVWQRQLHLGVRYLPDPNQAGHPSPDFTSSGTPAIHCQSLPSSGCSTLNTRHSRISPPQLSPFDRLTEKMGLSTLLVVVSFALLVFATLEPALIPQQQFLLPSRTADTITSKLDNIASACASTFSSLSRSYPTQPAHVEEFYLSAIDDEKFMSEHPRLTEIITSIVGYLHEVDAGAITDPKRFFEPCSLGMEMQTLLHNAAPTGIISHNVVAYDNEVTSWVKEHQRLVTGFAVRCGAADPDQAGQALALAATGLEECKTAFAVAYGVINPATMTDGSGRTSTAGGVRAWETGLVKEFAAVVGGVAAMELLL